MIDDGNRIDWERASGLTDTAEESNGFIDGRVDWNRVAPARGISRSERARPARGRSSQRSRGAKKNTDLEEFWRMALAWVLVYVVGFVCAGSIVWLGDHVRDERLVAVIASVIFLGCPFMMGYAVRLVIGSRNL